MYARREAHLVAAAEALRGHRIVWVTSSHVESAKDFDEIVRLLDGLPVARMCAANGRQRLDMNSSGRISFVSSRGSSGRGMSADLVFVDARTSLHPQAMEDIAPIVATSRFVPSPRLPDTIVTYANE